MENKTVYKVDIIEIIETLKEIYKLGNNFVNITVIGDNTISIIPYETKEYKQLPPPEDDIINYI